MNAVWNSYGQLCGCPEIFKKSCKFFCRELDIRVVKYMYDSAFVRFQFGYGAAVAYGIFVIIAIFSVFSLLVTKDKQDEYGKKKGGKA